MAVSFPTALAQPATSPLNMELCARRRGQHLVMFPRCLLMLDRFGRILQSLQLFYLALTIWSDLPVEVVARQRVHLDLERSMTHEEKSFLKVAVKLTQCY